MFSDARPKVTAPPKLNGAWLLYLRAAALNQNHQNDNEEYTCNYPDDCCSVHDYSFLQEV